MEIIAGRDVKCKCWEGTGWPRSKGRSTLGFGPLKELFGAPGSLPVWGQKKNRDDTGI